MNPVKKYMKRNPLLVAADFLLAAAVAGTLIHVVVDRTGSADMDASTCRAPGKKHELTISNDTFSQPKLQVNLCDTISITSTDPLPYHLNFGDHDNHITYAGFEPLVQRQNETINIDALEQGTYALHDHIRDKAVLELTVTEKQR